MSRCGAGRHEAASSVAPISLRIWALPASLPRDVHHPPRDGRSLRWKLRKPRRSRECSVGQRVAPGDKRVLELRRPWDLAPKGRIEAVLAGRSPDDERRYVPVVAERKPCGSETRIELRAEASPAPRLGCGDSG